MASIDRRLRRIIEHDDKIYVCTFALSYAFYPHLDPGIMMLDAGRGN